MIGQAIKNLSLNREDLVLATKVRGAVGKDKKQFRTFSQTHHPKLKEV
jgi:aryl-alcohol dehydrogenase-like predicted oxidoreductase